MRKPKKKPREFLSLLGPFDPTRYPKKRRPRQPTPEAIAIAEVCDWLEVAA